MAKWAKLHAKTSESYDFAEVANADPRAALFFLLCLPHCDVYGVLVGHTAMLKGKVCGLLDITAQDIPQLVKTLETAGLITRYKDTKGRPMLWLPGFERHQDVTWSRVGPPEHDLPPGWTAPQKLLDTAAEKPQCPIAKWLAEQDSDDTQTTHGVVSDNSVPDVDVDTDTDVDVDTEVDTDTHTETSKTSGASHDSVSVFDDDIPGTTNGEASPPVDARVIHDPNPVDELQLGALCNHLTGSLKRNQNAWRERLLEAARDPQTPLTDDDIITAFKRDPPAVTDHPHLWLRRMIAKKLDTNAGTVTEASDEDKEARVRQIIENNREALDAMDAFDRNMWRYQAASDYPGTGKHLELIIDELWPTEDDT